MLFRFGLLVYIKILSLMKSSKSGRANEMVLETLHVNELIVDIPNVY